MRIVGVKSWGWIGLAGTAEEAASAVKAGVVWKAPCGFATRVWYLPALKRLGVPIDGAEYREAILAAAKALTAVPAPTPIGYDGDCPLRPYQRVGCGLLAGLASSLLADQVGLGKCVMTETVLKHRLAEGGCALVVATMRSKAQWKEDFEEKVARLSPPPIFTVYGSASERRRAYVRWLRSDVPSVLLIHHDTLRRDWRKIAAVSKRMREKWKTLTVVFDEAGYIRNAETKIRFAAVEVGKHATHKIALTATPIENAVADVWSVIDWLRPGYLGPREAFEQRHVVREPRFLRVVKERFLNEVKTAIRPLYLRRTAREVGLELPRITTKTFILDMGPAQAKAYAQIIAMKARGVIDPKTATILERQVANDPTTIKAKGESPKLDELAMFIPTVIDDEKVVVFTNFKKFALRIAARLERYAPVLIAGGQTEDASDHAKRLFRDDPNTRILIATSAGERALNLQTGGVLVNMDLPWNPAAYQQRIGRIHRFGSKSTRVLVVNFVMRGTIEEKILKVLKRKQKTFDAVIETDGEDDVRGALMQTVSSI